MQHNIIIGIGINEANIAIQITYILSHTHVVIRLQLSTSGIVYCKINGSIAITPTIVGEGRSRALVALGVVNAG